MGFMFMHGQCCACSAMISFAPSYVPSIRVNGEKEAICEECFKRWNAIHRTAKGLEALPLDPRAYAPEPC